MRSEGAVTEPLLVDVPEELQTARLLLRPPRAGDGPMVNEAVVESIESLRPWMPWADPTPTVEKSEIWCRDGRAAFLARVRLPWIMLDRQSGAFVGSTGMPRLDWKVPRFEIGYWVRRRCEGRGFVTEAVAEMTRFAFGTLGAKRVEIRAADDNVRSWRVPERLGFRLEGVLRNEERAPEGTLRDTRVYAVTQWK